MNKPKEELKLSDMTNKTEDGTYKVLEQEENTSDQISLLAIGELLDEKKLKQTSRVKFEQVAILAKLQLFSDVFGTDFTKNLADLILKLQISTNGLGRKELVQLVQRRDGLIELQNGKPIQSKEIFR